MKVRNIVFSGAMASILMIGAATADALSHDGTKKVNSPATMTNPDYTTAKTSNVNFDGDYTTKNASGASVVNNVAETLTEYTFNYSGTNADGTAKAVNDVNVTTGVSKSDFAYKTKDGLTTETLASDKTYTASDYDAPTAADGTNAKVADNYMLDASMENVQRSSYSYADAQNAGEYVELGETARTLKQTVELNTDYTTGSIDVSSTDGALDGTLYKYTWSETGKTYTLSEDGSKLINLEHEVVEPYDGLIDVFTNMQTAYNTDAAKVQKTIHGESLDDGVDSLVAKQSTEDTNWANANAVLTTDTSKLSEIKGYYNTYDTARNAYETATSATSAFETTKANWETASTDYTNALAMYNTSIIDTVDKEANDAIAISVKEGEIANAIDKEAEERSKQDAELDSKISKEAEERSKQDAELDVKISKEAATRAEADEKIRADFAKADLALSEEIANEAATRAEADDQIRAEFKEADLALSNEIAKEAATREATDAKLQSAIDENRNNIAALDSKINDLDENLSAGIASSVALSSVAVANVQKGEMSIGGGYGNYNSKSAMAFGAALGITDNWSANAGVGFGFGKDTKASFRVGTNYKFKLF